MKICVGDLNLSQFQLFLQTASNDKTSMTWFGDTKMSHVSARKDELPNSQMIYFCRR